MCKPILLLLLAWTIAGCDRSGEEQAPAPKASRTIEGGVSDPVAITPVGGTSGVAADTDTAEAADADATSGETLEVDPAKSKVGFAVARATMGHVGHFNQYESSLRLEDGLPVALEIRVKLGSVAADRRGLTEHLKSPDFFHVDQFPSATFAAERLTPTPDADSGAYEVSGTMRLHGVEQQLTFPATIEVEADHVVGRATLDISAKAFGIDYEGMEAELAEDAVQLEIELVFPRAAHP